MKRLITTTAIVLTLGLPFAGYAQDAGTTTTADANATATPGFLATRSINQMLATDLIGHDVYARHMPLEATAPTTEGTATDGVATDGAATEGTATDGMATDGTATEGTATEGVATDGTATDGTAMASDGMATQNTGAMPAMTQSEMDNMDNVGQVKDFILSADGSVVALVIGIGGFLGVGEQDVAVSMDQVSFAANPDDVEDMYIVLNTSGEMLKTSPKFDRVGMGAMGPRTQRRPMARAWRPPIRPGPRRRTGRRRKI